MNFEPLSLQHADFILKLLNQKDWIKFIGDRKITDINSAETYIIKINTIPKIKYWVVKDSKQEMCLGLITFMQRDYLPYPDFGFAFLTSFQGKNLAYQASLKKLNELKLHYPIILACTLPENTRSIKLLLKLGFDYQEDFVRENQTLHLYRLKD